MFCRLFGHRAPAGGQVFATTEQHEADDAWLAVRGWCARCDTTPNAGIAVGAGPRDYECEDCIGMREHGCYCQAMGAVCPGGPAGGEARK